MRSLPVPACSFCCALSQCASFARAVPVITHALQDAAKKPAPTSPAAAETALPFIPSIGQPMTTLEILAPYLAHGIDCQLDYQDGHGSELVKLAGLAQGGFGKKTDRSARVAFADGMARWVPADKLTPVLRSFADLCTPLEDGTVPAVEVAKLAVARTLNILSWHKPEVSDGAMSVKYVYEAGEGRVWIERRFDVFEDEAEYPCNQCAIIDYLRSKHFAVGLSAGQYIQKQA